MTIAGAELLRKMNHDGGGLPLIVPRVVDLPVPIANSLKCKCVGCEADCWRAANVAEYEKLSPGGALRPICLNCAFDAKTNPGGSR